MLLDFLVQNLRIWICILQMGIYNLVIYGSFKVGRLMNYFNFSQGWDSLYINIIGVVEFELEDVFYVNYL